MDIIISCVDTRSARLEILECPLMKECRYWLDIGNNADSGQFVLGQPKNNLNRHLRHRLPVVSELFPEIIRSDGVTTEDLPSCSAVEALERQEPFINQTLAIRPWHCWLGSFGTDGYPIMELFWISETEE